MTMKFGNDECPQCKQVHPAGNCELDNPALYNFAMPPEPNSPMDDEELLFMLNMWGDLDYENGCKHAHETLLKYRGRIMRAVEALNSTPPAGDAREVSAKLIPHLTSVHNVDLIRAYGDTREAAGRARGIEQAAKHMEGVLLLTKAGRQRYADAIRALSPAPEGEKDA